MSGLHDAVLLQKKHRLLVRLVNIVYEGVLKGKKCALSRLHGCRMKYKNLVFTQKNLLADVFEELAEKRLPGKK